ncbi:venom protease-like [Anopheles ziemanni]|uniref:venom protease-like n=1 Tax=Anopheles coustani TaxID=139045 RepID=UPI002659D24A|nr:venom protease-like [Anopheles coustani]XP_058169323.1 venom protease-like [Anopheles ziemanni]
MWLWRVSGLFVLIVHCVYSQDAQTCYTNTGVTGVCTSLSECPAAFQLNINPFSFFGGAQRGCQNFFLIGSVCCAQVPTNNAPQNAPTYNAPANTPSFNGQPNAPTYNVPAANPTQPTQTTTTSAPPGPSSATTKFPQSDPVSTTTARTSTIRTTPTVVLKSRIDSEPTFDKPVLLPTPETGCGLSDVEHNRIVGGVPAALNGWPWMALIGYEDQLGDVDFRCGGSLITDRHVLSAAHCILSSLSLVRLGEHDLGNQTESAHVDVPVYKYVSHPSYDTLDGHSDLAILFLTRTVEFNDAIKPICLPSIEPVRSEKFIGFNPFIAGWGRTEENGFEAKVLQELQIPILENDECVQRFKKIRKLFTRKQFDNAVICAGFLDGGKDSCQGDSGGPLMLPYLVNNKKYYYFQVGVVSYGIGCARAELPGVYTRVSNFIDWIEMQVKS